MDAATRCKEEGTISFLGTGDGRVSDGDVPWGSSSITSEVVSSDIGVGVLTGCGVEGVDCLGTGFGSDSFEDTPSCFRVVDAVGLREEVGGAALVEDASCSRRVDAVVCLRDVVGDAALSSEDASCRS